MARLTIIALALLFGCMLTPFVVAQQDTDSDGVPDNADNCPLIDNPNQEDADNDGVGDVCDNCPNMFNPDQTAMEGEACDTCPIVPLGPEVCDSLDNDCDGFTDEDHPTNCGIGACSATGSASCMNGVLLEDSCTPGSPGTEVCDGLDNDCDGLTDCEDEDCFDDLVCLAPPPPSHISIPTLSQWGLITMAGILGVVGFMVIRRRKVTVQKD